MRQQPESNASQDGHVSHRRFARAYERGTSHDSWEERFMKPLRQEVTGAARGRVLEIGAGNGLNFALYQPGTVECVEAIEPEGTMLAYARPRAAAARVPVQLTQAAVEHLPFADASFDSAVATMVFCSVGDPHRGLREVRRVLRPGGALLLVEHVRAQNALLATAQTLATPFARLLAGNRHWNRNTEHTVVEAGFSITERRELRWMWMPFLVLHAVSDQAGA